MADQQPVRGRHRRNPPKPSKAKFVLPIAVFALLIGVGAVARGNNAPAPSPTPSIVESVTPSPTPTPTPLPTLNFATWNIAKPANNVVPAWTKRRDAIGNTISSSSADVLALQEANEVDVTGADGKRMTTWEDVQILAKASGYVALDIQEDACANGCVHTARILFKEASVHQVVLANGAPSAGHGELQDVASGLGVGARRQFSWAILESNTAPGPFLIISIHTSNQKSSKGIAQRAKIGEGFTKWVSDRLATSGLTNTPAILMGDFNSYLEREPKGMVYQLQQAGWTDVYDSAASIDDLSKRAHTSSYSDSAHGWPKKPLLSTDPNRIDHIMYIGDGVSAANYAVELHLKDDGTFDNAFRASDHLMVRSLIELYKPAQ